MTPIFVVLFLVGVAAGYLFYTSAMRRADNHLAASTWSVQRWRNATRTIVGAYCSLNVVLLILAGWYGVSANG